MNSEFRRTLKSRLSQNGTWIALFALILLLAIATRGDFLAARNLTNLMRQTSINGILTVGMTVVILTGGIDLSIGSLVALAGIAIGISQVNWGWGNEGLIGAMKSMALGCAVGGLAGFVNGTLISLSGIAPFVITLGMMVIARGLAMIFSNGSSISPMGDVLGTWAGDYFEPSISALICGLAVALLLWQCWKARDFLRLLFVGAALALFAYSFLTYRGIPFLVVFLALVVLIVGFALERTTWGRSVYAIGSNERAAYWAGVSIRQAIFWVYALMGLLSGLAGTLLSARLNGADPNAGQLFELDAIASVVIGGTSLKGGSGSIEGSIVGALIIAALNNGMDLLGIPSFYQMVFKGLIIIAAVAVDRKQAVRT